MNMTSGEITRKCLLQLVVPVVDTLEMVGTGAL